MKGLPWPCTDELQSMQSWLFGRLPTAFVVFGRKLKINLLPFSFSGYRDFRPRDGIERARSMAVFTAGRLGFPGRTALAVGGLRMSSLFQFFYL